MEHDINEGGPEVEVELDAIHPTAAAHPSQTTKALESIVVVPAAVSAEERAKILASDPSNGWTQRIEIYVSSISMKCKAYRNIHEATTIYYDRQSSRFTIFLILVSFAVSAISLVPFFTGEVFKYVIALLSVFNTTLATINKFLKYQEYSTKHRIASQKFLELHRNITEQFLLTLPDRANGKAYVSDVGRAFDSIMKSAPYPPEVVKTRIKMTFTPDNDVNVPSIFEQNTTVVPVPQADVPTLSSDGMPGSAAPMTEVQMPPPSTGITSVNPETESSTVTAPLIPNHQMSAMARFQLQRARHDMDSYISDYD